LAQGIAEQIRDEPGVIDALANSGIRYERQGNHIKALDGSAPKALSQHK
jgi:hypothetical protein